MKEISQFLSLEQVVIRSHCTRHCSYDLYHLQLVAGLAKELALSQLIYLASDTLNRTATQSKFEFQSCFVLVIQAKLIIKHCALEQVACYIRLASQTAPLLPSMDKISSGRKKKITEDRSTRQAGQGWAMTRKRCVALFFKSDSV